LTPGSQRSSVARIRSFLDISMDRPLAAGLPARGQAFWTLMVMLSAVGFGLVPVFARELSAAGMSATAIAFCRHALTALVTVPFLALRPGKRHLTLLGMAAGFSMGLGWISYVEAVKVAPVSTVGVIYMTYPLFTLALAWPLLGHRPSGRALGAALMILAGAALALTPRALGAAPVGVLLVSFAAPLAFGFAIVVLTGWLQRLSPLQRIATVPLGSTIGLSPLLLFQDPAELLPVFDHWPLILGLAFGTALVPALLYVVAAPRIGPARTAIAGSFELPTMFAVGWLAFGEVVGPMQALAGALVIGAILLNSRREQG
jgi:drug/metabolite transporter (DMT)-like permease